MTQKIINGNEPLARKIKSRRKELGLTIEEAASRAGVGTKTWYRYEAGESIRKDKCKGICKALNWYTFPNKDEEKNEIISIQKYKNHEAWSVSLENDFGNEAAISFAVGSDILYDHIEEELEELSSLPIKTHIGQLSCSWLKDILPQQFMMHYDYEFLYQMKCSLYVLRMCAKNQLSLVAHSVMEELLIYLCSEEASAFIELNDEICRDVDEEFDTFKDWVFDLFGDKDLITFLYSNMYLDLNHSYHFSHWTERQFYMD